MLASSFGRFYISSLLIIASATVCAEPAVFANGELVIPQGAMITGNSKAYFTDITFAMNAQGNLMITGANKNPLVTVESVEVQVMESFPVQVSLSVNGFLSVPCVDLLTPAVSYANSQFTVVLAESNLGPAESCIAVTEPFQSSIDLDVLDLPAGNYSVDVNGIGAEFTLGSL